MEDINIVDKLAQLADLKAVGALTEEEYNKAKAFLLQDKDCSHTETAIVPIIDDKIDPKYAENYSESGFWDKITSVLKKAGAEVIYKALQLYYATKNPNCPLTIKGAIYAALGYFILPIDIIPDVMPLVGFTDDLIVIGAALVMAHMYIDDWVIKQAKDKMVDLFGNNILKELKEEG